MSQCVLSPTPRVSSIAQVPSSMVFLPIFVSCEVPSSIVFPPIRQLCNLFCILRQVPDPRSVKFGSQRLSVSSLDLGPLLSPVLGHKSLPMPCNVTCSLIGHKGSRLQLIGRPIPEARGQLGSSFPFSVHHWLQGVISISYIRNSGAAGEQMGHYNISYLLGTPLGQNMTYFI